MPQVLLRFYEELNDYLPADKSKRDFPCRFEGTLTIAGLMQAVGVPVGEIDLVLCNGLTAALTHVVADGDRISAYPVFESLDIKGVTRVREDPLRRPAFLAAAGLEALALHLRQLGFDVCCGGEVALNRLAARADAEKRILLIRADDPAPPAARVIRLWNAGTRLQAAEVLARLDPGAQT